MLYLQVKIEGRESEERTKQNKKKNYKDGWMKQDIPERLNRQKTQLRKLEEETKRTRKEEMKIFRRGNKEFSFNFKILKAVLQKVCVSLSFCFCLTLILSFHYHFHWK